MRKLLFFLMCLFISSVSAQTLELGIQAGGAGYMGDLNQVNPAKISGPAAGAFVKANFDGHWGLRLQYTYGKIKADDALSDNEQFRARNLSFYSALNEASLLLDFNFFEYFSLIKPRKFTPYLFTGLAGLSFNPKAKMGGTEYELRNYATEGQAKPYKNYTFSIPYGAGMRYNIKGNWSLIAEIGYRTAFTDYLDDVSGVYAYPLQKAPYSLSIPQRLGDRSGEVNNVYIGGPGTQRGDFRKRDTYMFAGIGISFTFVSSKCYTF